MEFADRRRPSARKKRASIAREMFEAEFERPPADERELTGFIATQSRSDHLHRRLRNDIQPDKKLLGAVGR